MANFPSRPDWRRKRPAPRKAAGAPLSLSENIVWKRIVEPRERYRIVYRDGDNVMSDRTVELLKIGEFSHKIYFGVMHAGIFKTLRSDRIVSVVEQLTQGHEPSIRPQPTYSTQLPGFPLPNAVFKMPTTAVSNKTWTVDLNKYTCTCPEKRIRSGFGYESGQLGFVCPHMAKAILTYLPKSAEGWSQELLIFLRDTTRIHIDNLT